MGDLPGHANRAGRGHGLDGRRAHDGRLHGPVQPIERGELRNHADPIHVVRSKRTPDFGGDPPRDHDEHGHHHHAH